MYLSTLKLQCRHFSCRILWKMFLSTFINLFFSSDFFVFDECMESYQLTWLAHLEWHSQYQLNDHVQCEVKSIWMQQHVWNEPPTLYPLSWIIHQPPSYCFVCYTVNCYLYIKTTIGLLPHKFPVIRDIIKQVESTFIFIKINGASRLARNIYL